MSGVPGNGPDCFVVLPDSDAGAAVAGHVPFEPSKIVRHPSGRPWVLGRLAFSILSVVTGRDRALVVVGPASMEQLSSDRHFARCSSLSDLDEVLSSEAGVFYSIAALGGRVRIQGTASGLLKVYFARVGGDVIASDRPAILAQMSRAAIDDAALALRLLEPIPHPLADRALWRGVHTVPPGHYLLTRGNGDAEIRQWWVPPEPEQPIEVGANDVRAALEASVRVHLADRDKVSSELSGGFDSTSLTILAQREAFRRGMAPVLAVTAESRDLLGDDSEWAALVTRDNPHIAHHVVPGDDLPLVYDSLPIASRYVLDEPSPAISNHARVLAMTEVARRYQAQIHLTGHGGDHLFTGLPTLCSDLLRKRPLTAISRLNSYRGMLNWPLGPAARQLLAPGPYRRWLLRSATAGSINDWQFPVLTWGIRSVLHPWITPHARELIRAEIRHAAEKAEPLAPVPGRHLELDVIRDGTRLARALADIGGQAGVLLATPFFDDRVIEAALRVRVHERVQPNAYKPLLAQAMRGVVPNVILTRTTKGTGNLDIALGLRQHAPLLTELWADSRMAERGLIDPEILVALCGQTDSPALSDGALQTTVGCELWLHANEKFFTGALSSAGG
jgi:asparagine synthase (glutamine-hydrolysing)